jgi:hypothetical protein
MKMKQLLILISVLCSMNISAQVTIGKIADPHEAAILDLSQKETADPERGLLMPRVELKLGLTPFQLPTTVADTEEKATGMVVYNLAENAFVCPGLYVWDGSTWNRLMGEACQPYIPIVPAIPTCDANYYPPDPLEYVDIEVDADGTGQGTDLRTLRFLTYNLGANPNLTPKEQMAYVSTLLNPDEDVNVYGGLYQWGRKDAPHSLRCDMGAKPGYFTTALYPAASYNPAIDTLFVWGGAGSPVEGNFNDWAYPHVDASAFWGNGGGLSTQANTNYSATENTNNPCPAGFRVPTQHEWALLVVENDNSTSNSDNLNTDGGANGTTPPGTDNPITWVPVVNGKADGSSSSWISGNMCGYALYAKDDWDAALTGWNNNALGMDLTNSSAPEPLMFLPVAGLRPYYDGNMNATGFYGLYWSSTVSGSDCNVFTFYSTGVSVDGTTSRSAGATVRCVAE